MSHNLAPWMAFPVLLGLTLNAAPVAALEPLPTQDCFVSQDQPPKAMGLAVAYGILLGERYRGDELSREAFEQALMSLQTVVRLMAEREAEAACMLLAEIEDDYGLERPLLDASSVALPQQSEERQ